MRVAARQEATVATDRGYEVTPLVDGGRIAQLVPAAADDAEVSAREALLAAIEG